MLELHCPQPMHGVLDRCELAVLKQAQRRRSTAIQRLPRTSIRALLNLHAFVSETATAAMFTAWLQKRVCLMHRPVIEATWACTYLHQANPTPAKQLCRFKRQHLAPRYRLRNWISMIICTHIFIAPF